MKNEITLIEAVQLLNSISESYMLDIYDRAAINMAIESLEAQKYGYWEQYRNSKREREFRCSACRKYHFYNGEMIEKYLYCPHCGAKMERKN